MHPEHVAAFVREEVEILRARAADSELPIADIALEHDAELFVTVEMVRRPSLPTRNPDGTIPLGAGVLNAGVLYENVPDLSKPAEHLTRILYCDLTDFDSQPPTAELLAADRSPLPFIDWPSDLKNGGIVDGHKDWPRPWFCRPGFREYHTHPEHEDRPWDEIRGDGAPLHGLVLGLVADLTDRFVL
jgi:hypothetical protein